MSQYKIVIDSCGELPEDLKADGHFCTVPLLLDVDGYQITDDETFNQRDFLQRVKACIHSPKSSCPSPERYMRAYEGEAEHVYVVTLSGKLSGSYNSAVLAAQLYHEEHEDSKQIHVFNSKSASIGETLIGLKIQELEESGASFEEIVTEAGRLSGLKAFVANTLNIKPVMGSTKEGTIQQLGQARGMKKALSKMVEDMLKVTKNCESRVLAISHCNCPERAKMTKEKIATLAKFKKIIIINTAGVSSMYANDGGVILVL